MVSRGVKIGGAILGVIVLLGVIGGGYVATSFQQPTIGDSQLSWGDVTQETSEIRTTIPVDNPNSFGVPKIIDVSYTATLNDVTLASGQETVGFGPGKSTINLSTQMQNARISEWWVTHVNGGESSQLSVEASVSAPGFSRTIPARKTTIETDILGGFTEERERTVRVQNNPFILVSNQTARWGNATAEKTPLTFGTTIESAHEYNLTLDGVSYVVVMNNVTLGQNRVMQGINIAPGEQDRIRTTVALNTPKMADWWAEHVRDNEQSNLSVRMYGVIVEDGEPRRVPIRLYDETLQLETNILGDGGTSIQNLGDAAQEREPWPQITDSTRQWGAVTSETTEIQSTSTLSASDNNLTKRLTLDIDQRTMINDVVVANDSKQVDQLSAGQNQIDFTSEMNNSKVPRWWAAHINQDERSEIVTVPTALADVGFSKFDINIGNRTTNFTTSILSGMNGDRDETISIAGQDALVFSGISSEWGQATTQTAPINVEAQVQNELSRNVEVTKVDYEVTLGGVVLADKVDNDVDSLEPGSNTLPLTMRLNNQKMDEWWVQHLRANENGVRERSQLQITVEITVESRRGTTTKELDSLAQDETIETDILDQYEDR